MNGKLLVWLVLSVVGAVALAACGPFVGGPQEKTVYVGPYLVPCVGVGPQECMLVREDLGEDWTMFYDRIDGFDYEEGFEYRLRVVEEEIDNPPADASSLQWSLVEVVEKTRSLEGANWVLESYLGERGELTAVLSDSTITAHFREGQVQGNAGCNSYFGSYERDGDRLTFGPLAMTEMYCQPQALMDQEGAYLSVLASAGSYQIADDRLQMYDDNGELVLVYSVLEPAPLVGTLWRLTTYSDGQGGVVSPIAGTEITAQFGEEGQVAGSAGCNGYSASYEVRGNQLTVGLAASTMMMCPAPDGIMDQESAYLTALQSIAGYEIEGRTLVLKDASGEMILSYAVVEPTPLVGTTWLMQAYNNGMGGVVSALAGVEVTAIFGQDGMLTGSAGCNNYHAGYQAEGGAIQVGPPASTRMLCPTPEGIMDQESQYLAALERAVTYQIEGDRLLIHDADGARLVEYVATTTTGLSDDVLANMDYQSEWTQSGIAPLVDGEYREAAAPGSATETVVALSPHVARGELNGEPAAAVVLVTDPGGSGTFYDLAVVVERDGYPTHLATANLGDRIQMNSLAIEANQVVVDMIAHDEDDPMCCPTENVIVTFELQDGTLVETGRQTAAGGQDLVGPVWKWEQFLESNDNTIIVDNPEQYTLEFLPDGTVQMKADCNNASGRYSLSGSQL
ncbi:MAG: META domain-containing protein, partial [Anaerolineae bacterium]